MLRAVEGFEQDDEGDWVACLACLHRQHVRHRPPFLDRPWVLTAEGRDARVGAELDCPLCDRAELPPGLAVVRTAGPFDAGSLPAGLRRDHRIAAGTWGRLRVLEGEAGITLATDPPTSWTLRAGEAQAIPPTVAHAVRVVGPVRLVVEFLQAPGGAG